MSNSNYSRGADLLKRVKNPVKKFISFNSELNSFVFYDKENKVKNIKVPMPLHFAYIISGVQVKGIKEVNGIIESISSNLVLGHNDELIVLKYIGDSKKGIEIARGKWGDIKTRVEFGSYHTVVYAALKNSDGIELCAFSMKGSICSEWFEFNKQNKGLFMSKWISVLETKKMKKGAVSYNVPVFLCKNSFSKESETAIDKLNNDTLSPYFEDYFSKKNFETKDTQNVDLPQEDADHGFPTNNNGFDNVPMPSDKDLPAMVEEDDLPF